MDFRLGETARMVGSMLSVPWAIAIGEHMLFKV